jgi:hypothetical protein
MAFRRPYGEITVKGGAIDKTNFDTYNVMRIDDAQGRGRHHAVRRFLGGVGEPTICVAPRRCSTRYSRRPGSASVRCR